MRASACWLLCAWACTPLFVRIAHPGVTSQQRQALARHLQECTVTVGEPPNRGGEFVVARCALLSLAGLSESRVTTSKIMPEPLVLRPRLGVPKRENTASVEADLIFRATLRPDDSKGRRRRASSAPRYRHPGASDSPGILDGDRPKMSKEEKDEEDLLKRRLSSVRCRSRLSHPPAHALSLKLDEPFLASPPHSLFTATSSFSGACAIFRRGAT